MKFIGRFDKKENICWQSIIYKVLYHIVSLKIFPLKVIQRQWKSSSFLLSTVCQVTVLTSYLKPNICCNLSFCSVSSSYGPFLPRLTENFQLITIHGGSTV